MKKILAALTFVALIFTACTEETNTPTPVTVSLSKTTATELGLASSHSQMMFTVSNTTANEATIEWEHDETTSVTGWTYSTNGSSATSGTLTVPANGSVDVTFMIMPNSNAGVGTGILKFYDGDNQALTLQTFNYSLTTVTQYFEVITTSPTTLTVSTSDTATDYKMKLYNPNASDITLNWNSTVPATNPSNWLINVCDPFTCFGPSVVDGDFPIPAGDSVDFKFTINHVSSRGSATATANFYVATDSVGSLTSQTVTHSAQ
jgi:hypothetical protein